MTTENERNTHEETEEMEEAAPGTSKAVTRAISYVVLLAVGFFVGMAVSASAPGSTSLVSHLSLTGNASLNATPDSSANLTDFWEAWNALQANFVESHASSTPPTTQQKIYGAIEGLAASYGDPYTVYMPPEQAKLFNQEISGSFGGVGMEIGIKNGALTVISPLKDTPAANAGILTGDKIVSVDGTSTEGMTADQAVQLIRGPKGTTVTLGVMRNGSLKTFKLTRSTIQVPETKYGLDAKSGVFHIALYTFSANSAQLFDKALAAFKKSGSNKLVIDLRGNPGGYLDAAVNIASHFLPKGDVIVTEDFNGKHPNIVHRSLGLDDVPASTKIAVLINRGSASAAEILSGALQDHHRATLIGTRSFGKGSVQEVLHVAGGNLKITVARWLTPSGHSIEDGGLTPNIKVDRTQADVAAGKDPQMARAIQFLTTGK